MTVYDRDAIDNYTEFIKHDAGIRDVTISMSVRTLAHTPHTKVSVTWIGGNL